MIFGKKRKIMISFCEACTRPIREKYGLTQMEYDLRVTKIQIKKGQ